MTIKDKTLEKAFDLLREHGPTLVGYALNKDTEGLKQEGMRIVKDKVLPQVVPPQFVPFIPPSVVEKVSTEKLPVLVNHAAEAVKRHVQAGEGTVIGAVAKSASDLAKKHLPDIVGACINPIAGYASLISKGVTSFINGKDLKGSVQSFIGTKGLKEGQARILSEIGLLSTTVTGGFAAVAAMGATIITGIGDLKKGQARIEDGIGRLEMGQAQIARSLAEGFTSVENLVRYNSQLLDQVLEDSKTSHADLKGEHARTRQEMHARFDETQTKILTAIEDSDIRRLQGKLNKLLGEYKAFSALLQEKKPLLDRDLHTIEETAKDLMGDFEARFREQPVGSPARLPFLIGMAFCLGTWCDARSALKDPLDHCFKHACAIIDEVNGELRALTKNASLYALAVREKDVISQYVGLLQSLRALSSVERKKKDDVVLLALPGWDDGLQKVRELFLQGIQATTQGTRTPMPELTLDNTEEKEAWRKIDKLPTSVEKVSGEVFQSVLGIPDGVSLSQAEAKELLRVLPAVLEQNDAALKEQISPSL